MLIARLKKQENVVEYIIYMFQVHDMLRGIKFDKDFVKYSVAQQMSKDPIEQLEIEEWYGNIIETIKKEKIEKVGYVKSLDETISELILLHNMLQEQLKDDKYIAIYKSAQPFIEEFRQKADNSSVNEILVCINAIYGKLLLKLQQKEISEETEKAFDTFAKLLAYLSMKYKEIFASTAASN